MEAPRSAELAGIHGAFTGGRRRSSTIQEAWKPPRRRWPYLRRGINFRTDPEDDVTMCAQAKQASFLNG